MNSSTSNFTLAVILLLVVSIVVNILCHGLINNYTTETAIAYTTSNKITFNGIYVRDEQVLTFDGGNGVVSYAVADGGKLAKNSVVAYIYADESDIETKQEIQKLQSELDVLVKIQNPGTTEVAQPSYITSLIEEKYLSIAYNKELGNLEKVSTTKEELLVQLSTLQIVTDPDSSFEGRISELNTQISDLEAKLSEPVSTIRVDKPAYFVSYIDGYEDTLSIDTMDSLTVNDLNNVKDEADGLNTNNVIGKLIDGYKWYIVGVIDNSKDTFAVNDMVTLSLESSSINIKGKVTNIKSTERPNESIVYVQCDNMSDDVVQHRVETIEMSKENYQGIRVPKSALRFVDDVEGVYIKVGEQIKFKKVDVIYRANEYIISKANADDDYLALYDDIVVEGVSS